MCHVSPLFLFRFCIWRGSKNQSYICHVLREVLFMLEVTHSQDDDETEFQVSLDTCVVSLLMISLDSVNLSILASKYMIFSIFQVSRDRERCFTASVRHFTLCSILLEGLFFWNTHSSTAGDVNDHSIAWIWFA